MNLKPVNNYILIQPKSVGETTESGIYVPGKDKEKSQEGRVIALDKNVDVAKEGDLVLFKKWTDNEYKIGDTLLVFVKSDDVLAVYSE